MSANQFIFNAHSSFIESTYEAYKINPSDVDIQWQKFFEGFEYALLQSSDTPSLNSAQVGVKELQVFALIDAYRHNGHLVSLTNPLRPRKDRSANLDLHYFGLTDSDLSTHFTIGNEIGLHNASLQQIIDRLKTIYTQSIGIEIEYLRDPIAKKWLRNKIENTPPDYGLDLEDKKRILLKLNQTTVLEKFLGTKYLGEKRFSLEGGESTIPALDFVINTSVDLGAEEIIIGMAHRGRLNVLANILGKTYAQIFSEFEGNAPEDLSMGDGDVKYHLGYSSMKKNRKDKDYYLKLVPNPSHLESVSAVAEGFARAKADLVYNSDYDRILPIIIHGDAAIAGQGSVYELIQMSKLKGYYTGGTIHMVINNQIGFTTDFEDARSSDYCTSVASVVQAPVIHVNGDDVEAVVYAAKIASEWRGKFNSDIYIDIVCYRKHGHNEADDPKYTQPHLYSLISGHKNPRELYCDKLRQQGTIEAKLAGEMEGEFWQILQDRLDAVRQKPLPYEYQEPEMAWKSLKKLSEYDFQSSPKTGISQRKASQVIKSLTQVPEGFHPLRKVEKLLLQTKERFDAQSHLDWAACELLAYGSLLAEGHNIRMSGQDVKRGTFSHRHAVFFDKDTNEEYNRLNHIKDKQGNFLIYNSLLSEFAVLGFEFGYSLSSPENLVIWEAQFGDFANGAQTIIDQFITTSQSKWNRMSGLIMLLPHGYEGQGPEHSSARLERFLQASAESNMYVTNITTPANFFHAIRRQLVQPLRIPLIVMTPKSLLRHPACVSSLDEILNGSFQEIIPDDNIIAKSKVRKILFCSGKIYYDLLAHKNDNNNTDVAIIRMEQLYPFARKQFDQILKQYKNATFIWVQEEPENMGSWSYILRKTRGHHIDLISRKTSASPSTGFKKIFLKEQQTIIDKAFA